MSKRSVFTTITPLPYGLTREAAVRFLHDHNAMMDLNPLVIAHQPIPAPPHAPAEERSSCVWYELTDKIALLPGSQASSKAGTHSAENRSTHSFSSPAPVRSPRRRRLLPDATVSYTCGFFDLPDGLQTHCYAPLGLEMRSRWTVGGAAQGEPRGPVELGLGAGAAAGGLYVREDVEMRCNFVMTGFVKKTLKKAHGVLVERLKIQAVAGEGTEKHTEARSPVEVEDTNGKDDVEQRVAELA